MISKLYKLLDALDVAAELLEEPPGDCIGTAISLGRFNHYTAQIIASTVTDGATVYIEATLDNTNWHAVKTQAVTGNGSTLLEWNGAYNGLRARTSTDSGDDGTYTVLLLAVEG